MAINPAIGAAAITGGGDFLTSLASQIFNTRDTSRLERLAEYLRSRLGQQAIPQGQQEAMATRSWASMAPQMNKYAEGVGQRLNLDSGVAQGALMDRIWPTQMGIRNDLAMKNVEMTANSDARLQALLAQIESSIAG